MDCSNQACTAPMHALQRSSRSKKHHRKKPAQPANPEALNLMSSTYGAAGESFAKPKRQPSAVVRKAQAPTELDYSASGEDADYV